MKYIRTKDGIYETKNLINVELEDERFKNIYRDENWVLYEVIKQADTIEELCDEFVLVEKMREVTYHHKSSKFDDFKSIAILNERYTLYGAIWTNKGLIYVAKMNNNRKLELI